MSEAMPYACGVKTVATPGVPEALTNRDIRCERLILRASSGNSGVVYIVDPATNERYPSGGLSAGEQLELPIQDPRVVMVDVSVGGEGVDWLAV